jgi:signal transduction histidine kinase
MSSTEHALEDRWFGYRREVAFQLVTLLVVSIAILISLVVDPTSLRSVAFAIAMGVFGAATVLVFPLGKTDSNVLLLVPVLDMIALIVMRQVPDHVHAIGYLAILPALWLGWSGRPLFAAVAVVLSLGLIDLPGLNSHGPLDLEHALRNFLTPAVVAVAATSTCLAVRLITTVIQSLQAQEETVAEALRREQHTSKMLDAIVDAVDTSVFAFDADGSQILANRQAQRHPAILESGLSARELETAGLLFRQDRVTPLPADDGIIGRALKGEEYMHRVVWAGAPDGRQYALSASARSLIDESGHVKGTVLAVNDVTSYLQTIAAKDDFVASVSDELRTPLASIVGYLELIEDDPRELPEDIRKHLSVIDRNTQRLESLINDLLATVTEKEQTMALERRSTDLSQLCRETVDAFAKRAHDSRVHLRLHAPDAAVAMADEARLRQLIGNLVSNAIKFAPSGTVDVCVEPLDDSVVVTVADSGVGVPPDELDAIMSRFYRATTVRERFPGMGLGLSVSKSIVEAHGGAIAIASEEQRGTTVTVTLPLR